MSLKIIEGTLFFCCDSSKIVVFNGIFYSMIAEGEEQTFVEQTVQAGCVLFNKFWGICEAFFTLGCWLLHMCVTCQENSANHYYSLQCSSANKS